MKRIALFVLLIALLPLQVSAATPFKARVSTADSAFLGEEICLTLSFSQLPEEGLCGIDLELSFDDRLVSFVGASIEGFPEEGAWCGTGRLSGSRYLYFIFDEHEDADGFAPVALTEGSGASVSFTFFAKEAGVAEFSLGGYGSVMGTVFANGSTKAVYGQGDSVSVSIVKRDCPDMSGNGFTVKDGVMYVRPEITVAELGAEGMLYRADGSVVEGSAMVFKGDSFEFKYCNPVPVVIFLDANGDGRFSTADYLRLKLHIKGLVTLEGSFLFAADADGDGEVTATDSFLVAEALAGTAYPF